MLRKHQLRLGFGMLSLIWTCASNAQWANTPNSTNINNTNAGNLAIATTTPFQKLTLGPGNMGLVNANGGLDGNMYFGGVTWQGQPGMRLFGGLVNGSFPAGFIDVMT